MSMTPEAKRELSSTIRSLRPGCSADLHDATESAYRLSVHEREAGLSEAARAKRERLDEWIKEQERAEAADEEGRAARGGHPPRRREAGRIHAAEPARLPAAHGGAGPSESPGVVTGGWESRGYKDFRTLAPALVRGDETEGYEFLLRLVFEDLATDLPGLYGPAGVAELIPSRRRRSATSSSRSTPMRWTVCWTDDMTLGWVYQYWNDPEREALDAKLNAGGKLEPHEIASKTQMFTERYMVEWLLQNSLGPMWLAMCKKHGWTPEVEADGTLARLEERRVEWRAKRESGEVSLTELMPLHTDAERRWAYYLPQPIPDDAVEHALESIRDLKALDPAVGSGHFLVVLSTCWWPSTARKRGTGARTDRSAGPPGPSSRASWRTTSTASTSTPGRADRGGGALAQGEADLPRAEPERLNLVASNLRLASLADDDPALVELRREVERETGIPAALTDTIVHALQGADHLGSLLKIDAAVDEARNSTRRRSSVGA